MLVVCFVKSGGTKTEPHKPTHLKWNLERPQSSPIIAIVIIIIIIIIIIILWVLPPWFTVGSYDLLTKKTQVFQCLYGCFQN